MSFSISLDVGKWGGFYFTRRKPGTWGRTRLCLGWVALTLWPEEIDATLDTLADKIRPGWRGDA